MEQVIDDTSSERHQQITIPFVHTSPVWDVRWLILLLPIWWFFGVEQFIWVLGFGWAALKSIVRCNGRIAWLAPQRWYFVFLVVCLISGLFIVESFRYITFARNFGTYLAAFFVFIVITNEVRSWEQIQSLINAGLFSLVISAVIGFLGVLQIWTPAFTSILGYVLPQSIAGTDYGSRIAIRTIGNWGWFIGLGRYFRLSSLFLFSTSYAAVLAFCLPFFVLSWRQQRGLKLMLSSGVLVLIAVNLFFTTARISFVAVLVGFIYFLLFSSRYRGLWRGAAIIVSLLLVAAVLTTTLLDTWDGENTLVVQFQQGVETFLQARGGGSFADRLTVYEYTLRGVMERPVFGWGTERDFADFRYPAGSHNQYLAILYHQGIVGFMVFLALLVTNWSCTRPVSSQQVAVSRFLRYGRWFFIVVLVNDLGTVPIVDATVYVLLWLFMSLLIVGRIIALNTTK